jgi:hypothetical protein
MSDGGANPAMSVALAASVVAGAMSWYNTTKNMKMIEENTENIVVAADGAYQERLKAELGKVEDVHKDRLKVHEDKAENLKFDIEREREFSEKLRADMDAEVQKRQECERKIEELKIAMEEALKVQKAVLSKKFAEKLEKAAADHARTLEAVQQDHDTKIIGLMKEKSEMVEYYNQQTNDLAESQQNLRETHTEEIAARRRQFELLQQSLKDLAETLELERAAHAKAKVEHERSLQVHAESLVNIKHSHAEHMRSVKESHGEAITKLEAQTNAHNSHLEEIHDHHNRKIDAKHEEMQGVHVIHSKKMDALQKNHELDIASLKSNHKMEIEQAFDSRRALEVEHRKALEGAKGECDRALQDLETLHKSSIAKKDREIKELNELHNSVVSKYSQKHDEILQEERDSHDKYVERAESKRAQLEAELEAEHKKCKALQSVHESALEDVRDELEKKMKQLRNQLKTAKSMHAEELEELESSHSIKLKNTDTAHKSLLETIDGLNITLKQREADYVVLKQSIEFRWKESEEIHGEEIAQVKAQRDKLKQMHQEAREEFELRHKMEVDRIRSAHAESQSKAELLETELKDAESRVDSLKGTAEGLRNSLEESNEKNENVQKQIMSDRETHRQKLEVAAQQETLFMDTIVNIKAENEGLHAKINSLVQQTEQLEQLATELKANSVRDARKAIESVKKLQFVKTDAEARLEEVKKKHENDLAEQTKQYSAQLLKIFPRERLEDEEHPAARVSLFIAMLLAGETICQGVGTIKEKRLVSFLKQINSPLFLPSQDAASLASSLVTELSPASNRGSRTVGASQFAQYLLAKLSNHPLSLEKLRTIALASYLSLDKSSPKTVVDMSPASKAAKREFYENNIRLHRKKAEESGEIKLALEEIE